ncbi:MAG: ATP-binding protein [Acidimicrobiia bacterium]
MTELPTGTVTFLFTDLVDSTRLWEQFPDAMRPALARHDEVLRTAIAARDGHVVKSTGDGIHAVFVHARDALTAAADAQVALQAESWVEVDALQVRMGLHTCEVELRDGDYYGSAVNRAARLMGTAHGGQVVLSSITAELAREAGFDLRDLGEHRLAGLSRPERVWQLSADGLATEFPPLRSLDALPGNLTRQLTSFVGRDAELEALAELVRARTLVTLTGVGGVGKTRLALEVAAVMVGEFDDGAWLCELAPVTDPDAVWDTLAATFRVLPPPGRGLDEMVLEYLAAKHLLLVLDNCEHQLDAAADVVKAIESRCPRVTVLATSREGLAVPGEQLVAVPSLGVPATDADAAQLGLAESVRLFCDRAASARSDFKATGDTLGSVGVLCRRLDGIPLAIELAAARVASLAPEDLVARLDQRFKLLARGSRASLERHQTLRNTIDWSYDLLDDTERDALQCLSVFAGGGDLAAAEAVLANDELDELDVVDVVGHLVDKSLVVADAGGDGRLRYRMLESIRQYAQERLEASGNLETVRARHAAYYVSLAEAAGPGLRSRDQLEWASRMAQETDNLRTVLDWAIETGSPDLALRMVAPLAVSGIPIGFSALDWAETAIGIPGAPACLLFPDVASWAVWSATLRGDFALADEFAAQVDEFEAARGERSPSAARSRTTLAFFRGEFDQAVLLSEEWVALARARGEPFELANALLMLSGAHRFRGELELGQPALEEGVRIARAAAIPSALSIGLTALGTSLPITESDRILGILDEATEIGMQIGDRTAVVNAIGMSAMVHAYRGESVQALEQAVDCAVRLVQSGDFVDIAGPLFTGGLALTQLGHPEPGAVLTAAARRLALGELFGWVEQVTADTEARLLVELGATRLRELGARSADLAPADALAYLISAAQITIA